LRETTAAHDVLLVFDEVMTSRLARGGMQEIFGVDADLRSPARGV
jgi:glutamate-1-semialdehyde 2,1-aminomutase